MPLTPSEFRRLHPHHLCGLPSISAREARRSAARKAGLLDAYVRQNRRVSRQVGAGTAAVLCSNVQSNSDDIDSSSAWTKGDVTLEPGATLFYTAAPPPYITGTTMRASDLEFPFTPVPPIDEAEKMSFQERIQDGSSAPWVLASITSLG